MNPMHTSLPGLKPCCLLYLACCCLGILCTSCSSSDETQNAASNQRYHKGEYIYRKYNESLFTIPAQSPQTPEPYPWEQGHVGNHLKITKEFFRCKGSSLNPARAAQEKGELVRYFDCGGADKHSLPLRDKKEFVYPILMDLLNYIQAKTQKRVVITSGHRCPDHNTYVDPSESNRFSKHMVGAEVSFYVQGMENRPDAIIKHLQEYFGEKPRYQGKKDFIEFQRYTKEDTDVSTQPWYNKEIFIKLFQKKEGRNFDNRHPYPYISIQVRYDWDLQEKVIYTWDKATHNYLRF